MTRGESSSFEDRGTAVPQTAMASGSDDGEPGEHLAEPPLQAHRARLRTWRKLPARDQALLVLAQLRRR